MTNNSRSDKNLKNSFVSLTYFICELIVTFIARKYFLDYLGKELLGLNTLVNNILQFLNLAELGITSAVGFSLYKPIKNKDYTTINDIVSFQGILYRRIGLSILIGAIVLCAFFPLIFDKIELPLCYAYATFAVLLYSALLGYFVNYRMIVLSSAQLDYKNTIAIRSCKILCAIFQTLAIMYMPYPYETWLFIHVIFSTITSIWLNMLIRKTCPWLTESQKKYYELKNEYNIIILKIKQLFFHRFSAFILTQLSPIIIYALISVSMVAIFGNYGLITTGIFALCNAVFNSIAAGVGDLIAEGNRDNTYSVFKELFCVRFLISTILSFCVYELSNPFIILWIGQEYLLSDSVLILISITLFINISRNTVDIFINGYGLFHDIWAPVVEAILNIGLSILLGYMFGLSGILSGVLMSLVIVVLLWKPYFLYKNGLKRPLKEYVEMYSQYLVISLIAIIGTKLLMYKINYFQETGWIAFIIKSLCITFTLLIIISLLFYSTKEFRHFISRFTQRLINRKQP